MKKKLHKPAFWSMSAYACAHFAINKNTARQHLIENYNWKTSNINAYMFIQILLDQRRSELLLKDCKIFFPIMFTLEAYLKAILTTKCK